MDPAQATLYGAGIGVLGTLLGVALGLFGERRVRTWGEVRWEIRWRPTIKKELADAPRGVEVYERQLGVTFLNRKDVPVTVWDMRVTFYKGGKPLEAHEDPGVEFSGDRRGKRPRFELVTLPPRIAVRRSVFVSASRQEPIRKKEAQEADRIEFVAVMEGSKDVRTRLASCNEPKPQTERC